MAYAFLFGCLLARGFFFLFLGTKKHFLVREVLSLEPSEAVGLF